MEKHIKSDGFWLKKWQQCQPMSKWYEAHEPNKPHIAAIWKVIETASETNGKIPSEVELAYKHNTSIDSVRRILKNFVLAGGAYRRNGRAILILSMPNMQEQPEPKPTTPEITLRDIYDKLSELIELTKSVWSSGE